MEGKQIRAMFKSIILLLSVAIISQAFRLNFQDWLVLRILLFHDAVLYGFLMGVLHFYDGLQQSGHSH